MKEASLNKTIVSVCAVHEHNISHGGCYQRQQNTIIFHMVDVIKVTLVKYLSDPMCMVPMCSGPPSGLMLLPALKESKR
jgi:hypothetical protein